MEEIAVALKQGTRCCSSCQRETQQNTPLGGLPFSLKAAVWSQDPDRMGLRYSWCLSSDQWVSASRLMHRWSSVLVLWHLTWLLLISRRRIFELPPVNDSCCSTGKMVFFLHLIWQDFTCVVASAPTFCLSCITLYKVRRQRLTGCQLVHSRGNAEMSWNVLCACWILLFHIHKP